MAVVASAPGKVLITGGYLILERPNAGLVLSTSARFYAIVRPLYEEIKPESWAWAWTDVKLTSPQLSRVATYKLSLKDITLQCTSSRDTTNPFVEQAVQYAVAAAKAMHIDKDKKDVLNNLLLRGLDITILGCNDFYSYRNQDERELKRQRRKQSNRESARRSRLRKQAEYEDLAVRAESLKEENAVLRGEAGHLRKEYEQLLAQNNSLKEKLGEMPKGSEDSRLDRNGQHFSGDDRRGHSDSDAQATQKDPVQSGH